MALTTSYLITTKNLEPFLNSLINAKAPQNFTQKFLENLEFKSTNDRLFINMLKGLGFIDSNGVPTDRYFKFLDQSQSKRILAEAIRDAYGDLFAVNINANEMTANDVKNKLKTITQGQYSEKVISWMANTFKALTGYADWSQLDKPKTEKIGSKTEQSFQPMHSSDTLHEEGEEARYGERLKKTQLHYNIQIHLPESRDQSVYNAIFESLKKHLL